MILPYKGLFILTQQFGVNPQNYSRFLVQHPDGTRKPMKGHNGLDFGTPHRTEIIAPHSGEVKEATIDPEGYGWYVKIENEVEGSVLAHMDTIEVKVGFQLNEGDHIGWSDNSGYSTGPHLHWGYYRLPRDRANGIAGFIDQTPYLKECGIDLILGQLPRINPATIASTVPPSDGTYKGIDTTNMDSLHATIDAWYDVAHGKYKTQEQYQALEIQLEEVKRQLEATQRSDESVANDLKNYNEMKALGYNTINDINRHLQEKDSINITLQKEIAEVRSNSAQLAAIIANSEKEEHETASQGMKALDDNKNLHQVIKEIADAANIHGVRYNELPKLIADMRDVYDRFIEISKKEEEPIRKAIKVINSFNSFDFVMKLFQVKPKSQEVK